MAKRAAFLWLLLSLLVQFSCYWPIMADAQEDFVECLNRISHNSMSNNDVYTPKNSSYLPILRFSIQNLRFNTTRTPRPRVIVTPREESEVQSVIRCAKEHDIQVRIRGGGHDYEGLSYTTDFGNPFLTLDLFNMRNITVYSVEKTAWVGAGSTIGELYYRVSEKSPTLGFPAGSCPTVGVGGHFSGGGYGVMLRKYGLAADQIIDARLVDADGRILDRKLMGEDLFWAIRGGGGNTFGVVLAWKVQLVDVPPSVTVFTIKETRKPNAMSLVHKWQSVASNFPKELFISVHITRVNASTTQNQTTTQVSFNSIYLGGVDQLLPIMHERFPALGLTEEHCTEMSWIQSVLYFAGFPNGSPSDVLLRRTPLSPVQHFKAKSDYVKKSIPVKGLDGIWKFFEDDEATLAQMIMSPYGGRMDEISDSSIPFPHRAGNLYKIQHLVYWNEEGSEASERHISWIRRLYAYMGLFVSKLPREAYINYRDLDIGMNSEGNTSYLQASIWGIKYFKNNFDRLVHVKTSVDPSNFFRNEQSIPPLTSCWKNMRGK
ncbi:unnamed protein product [Cuscuta campestris]|uniref:FAD-binding PCMH-type domain-containing protein n=1 Tax=Cuscuta campestris TaxID=132261 RepID=A0A484KYE9_9ASTE|nr:unnamed protein product [Cuscuta campestris]